MGTPLTDVGRRETLEAVRLVYAVRDDPETGKGQSPSLESFRGLHAPIGRTIKNMTRRAPTHLTLLEPWKKLDAIANVIIVFRELPQASPARSTVSWARMDTEPPGSASRPPFLLLEPVRNVTLPGATWSVNEQR